MESLKIISNNTDIIMVEIKQIYILFTVILMKNIDYMKKRLKPFFQKILTLSKLIYQQIIKILIIVFG